MENQRDKEKYTEVRESKYAAIQNHIKAEGKECNLEAVLDYAIHLEMLLEASKQAESISNEMIEDMQKRIAYLEGQIKAYEFTTKQRGVSK